MESYIKNEIDNLKDELRNVKSDYIKKDDLDYRKLKEKTDKNSEDLTELKTNIKTFSIMLDKNNNLTEQNNITTTRLTTILETLTDNVKETKEDVKELSNKVNKIDNDTSKNTENRLTTKQIVISIITALLLGAIIGGLSIQNSKEGGKTAYNTTINKQLT
ncbi:hypothetical protein NPD5_3438 [Clostridium sporogenes]|uniref:Uncharacterized protein n=1 Tax=Clostridium sporogenes TaxID=1509 RepID=A0A1L3NKK8_CLOSG|nr:hypothetical protein [Clostridium sporogenes]APH16650.1 hypothetical protein NPD5_3438 [Clostridium sporogenes]